MRARPMACREASAGVIRPFVGAVGSVPAIILLALLACPSPAVATEPIRTPCFGDTVVEATILTVKDWRRGAWNAVSTDSMRTMCRQTGDIDTIWVYLDFSGDTYTGNARCAIYDTTAFGVNATLDGVSEARSLSNVSTADWFGFKCSPTIHVVGGHYYAIGVWAQANAGAACSLRRKTSTGAIHVAATNVTYDGNWPNPWNAGSATSYYASIYAHVVVPKPGNMRRRRTMEMGGVSP